MNISILLPYKENFSPEYPGAVSLFVYETSKISKYKKNITVFGNTKFKKKFNLRYVNIELKKDCDNIEIIALETKNLKKELLYMSNQQILDSFSSGYQKIKEIKENKVKN